MFVQKRRYAVEEFSACSEAFDAGRQNQRFVQGPEVPSQLEASRELIDDPVFSANIPNRFDSARAAY